LLEDHSAIEMRGVTAGAANAGQDPVADPAVKASGNGFSALEDHRVKGWLGDDGHLLKSSRGIRSVDRRPAPARHWRSYGDDPLPSCREALDEPFRAFPSWFMRITCDRCGKVSVLNEAHTTGRRREIQAGEPPPQLDCDRQPPRCW
jgi:hypothetical protein